jgi:hypothetical protein
MATCNPETLANSAKKFGTDDGILRMIRIYLLCKWLNRIKP